MLWPTNKWFKKGYYLKHLPVTWQKAVWPKQHMLHAMYKHAICFHRKTSIPLNVSSLSHTYKPYSQNTLSLWRYFMSRCNNINYDINHDHELLFHRDSISWVSITSGIENIMKWASFMSTWQYFLSIFSENIQHISWNACKLWHYIMSTCIKINIWYKQCLWRSDSASGACLITWTYYIQQIS